jgi:hypothetical protein
VKNFRIKKENCAIVFCFAKPTGIHAVLPKNYKIGVGLVTILLVALLRRFTKAFIVLCDVLNIPQ